MGKYTIAVPYAKDNVQPVPSAGKYAKGAKYGKRESRNSVEDQFWFYVKTVICKQHFGAVYHC